MQPTKLQHDILPKPHPEMKRIAQNNLRTHFMQAARHHAFHCAIGAHRHEDRRLHHAMIESERASAGVGALVAALRRGGIGFKELEIEHVRDFPTPSQAPVWIRFIRVSTIRIAPEPAPLRRSPAHYLWAALIARIYEAFPLLCPLCDAHCAMPDANSIAFMTHSAEIRQILEHIGVDSEPPRLSPARGPPLWEDSDTDAQTGGTFQAEPEWESDWDGAAQPSPDYEVDQRISW
jgi:hypothetical protein